MEINMRVTKAQIGELYSGNVVTIYKDYGELKAYREGDYCILYYDKGIKKEKIAELKLTRTHKAFQSKLNNYLASIHTLVREELAEKRPFYDFLCWFKDLMTSWPKCP